MGPMPLHHYLDKIEVVGKRHNPEPLNHVLIVLGDRGGCDTIGMRFNVVSYDPAWPEMFESIRAELEEALQAVPVHAIEHVGSTAVPGLAAKPVIDVDVVVDREQLEPALRALEAIGYQHRGDLGVPDRHSMAAPDDAPRRHVYVVVEGSLALRNHLGVRDVLRTSPAVRAQYGQLKRELSQRDFTTPDEYVAAKSEVLQKILEEAGIGPEERAAIKNITAKTNPHSELP